MQLRPHTLDFQKECLSVSFWNSNDLLYFFLLLPAIFMDKKKDHFSFSMDPECLLDAVKLYNIIFTIKTANICLKYFSKCM